MKQYKDAIKQIGEIGKYDIFSLLGLTKLSNTEKDEFLSSMVNYALLDFVESYLPDEMTYKQYVDLARNLQTADDVDRYFKILFASVDKINNKLARFLGDYKKNFVVSHYRGLIDRLDEESVLLKKPDIHQDRILLYENIITAAKTGDWEVVVTLAEQAAIEVEEGKSL
jgi:hypothetical protein